MTTLLGRIRSWHAVAYWRAPDQRGWTYQELEFLAFMRLDAVRDGERVCKRIAHAGGLDVRVVQQDERGAILGSWRPDPNGIPIWHLGQDARP